MTSAQSTSANSDGEVVAIFESNCNSREELTLWRSGSPTLAPKELAVRRGTAPVPSDLTLTVEEETKGKDSSARGHDHGPWNRLLPCRVSRRVAVVAVITVLIVATCAVLGKFLNEQLMYKYHSESSLGDALNKAAGLPVPAEWVNDPLPSDGTGRLLYSISPYDGEDELLMIRLNELAPVVDVFVFYEAEFSYSGRTKELRFPLEQVQALLPDNLILYVVVPRSPDDSELSGSERRVYFREQMVRLLCNHPQHPNSEDLVLVSDLDEIPRASALRTLKQYVNQPQPSSVVDAAFPVLFSVHDFMYDFGCRRTETAFSTRWIRVSVLPFGWLSDRCEPWTLSHLLPGDEAHNAICIDDLRDPIGQHFVRNKRPITVVDGGWHLSYFLDREAVHDKIRHAGDSYKDVPRNHDDDRLDELVQTCRHINDRESGVRRDAREDLMDLCAGRTPAVGQYYYPVSVLRQACKQLDSSDEQGKGALRFFPPL